VCPFFMFRNGQKSRGPLTASRSSSGSLPQYRHSTNTQNRWVTWRVVGKPYLIDKGRVARHPTTIADWTLPNVPQTQRDFWRVNQDPTRWSVELGLASSMRNVESGCLRKGFTAA